MLKTLSVTVTVLAVLALGVWMLPGTETIPEGGMIVTHRVFV